MRKILLLIFILVVVTGCKKEKSPVCKLTSLTNPSGLVTYEYDSQNRVIKLLTGSAVITLNYFKDSVVLFFNGSSSTTYFLNSAGFATSSKSKPVTNSNFISLQGNYQYDNDGYLIHAQEISQQMYNGTVIKDTNIRNFIIQNGNMSKYIQLFHGYSEQNFDYDSKEAKANVAFTMNPAYPWPFLGRSSKNLIASVKDEKGNVIYNATYEFDGKGNVTKKITTSSNNTSLGITQYNYQCN